MKCTSMTYARLSDRSVDLAHNKAQLSGKKKEKDKKNTVKRTSFNPLEIDKMILHGSLAENANMKN